MSAGMLYLADETTGIWRIAADPEADTTRELMELVAPRGKLGSEVKGLALHQAAGLNYLLAADEEAAAVHVYALPAGKHLGQFKLGWFRGREVRGHLGRRIRCRTPDVGLDAGGG